MKHGPRTILLKLLTILLSGSPYQWWTRQQVTAGLIPQQSQLKKLTLHVQHLFRATNAKIAGHAGINQFQMFATVNTKKLHGLTSRKCNTRSKALGSLPATGALNSDQVISANKRDGGMKVRAPGPGLELSSFKLELTSTKLEGSSFKLSNQPVQLTSCKLPNHTHKLQASSLKLQAH